MAWIYQEFYFWKWLLAFIMLLLHICATESEVQNIVPIEVNAAQNSYQAEKNHNITLEFTFNIKSKCSRSLSVNWVDWFVFCERMGDNKMLYWYIEHKDDISEFQDEQFSGRVVFDKDGLRKGRIRLHVSSLKIEDSGCYQCQLSIGSCFGLHSSTLNVTEPHPPAPHPPTISPPPKRRGMTGLYFAVVAVVVIVLAIYWSIKRKRTRTTGGGSSETAEEQDRPRYGSF